MERITLVIHLKNRDTVVDSVVCEDDEQIVEVYKTIDELRSLIQQDTSGVFFFGRTTTRISEISAYRVYQKEVKEKS